MQNPIAHFGTRVRSILSISSLFTLGALAACSESATVASEQETFMDLSQAQIVTVSGASQEGEAGSFLSEPLTVEIRSKGGTPMAGVAIEWVFQAGQGVTTGNGSNGSATTLTSYTDSKGRTAAVWLLGTRAGTQTSSAQILIPAAASQSTGSGAPGQDKGNKVGFTAKVKPASIAAIDLTPKDASAQPGQKLQFTAVATDDFGNVIADSGISWRTSDSNLATVDGNGLVTVLGTGQTIVTAKSGRVESSSSVSAVAAGSAAVVGVAGQNQTGAVGQRLATSPAVEVRDAQGQPVAGVTVTWSAASGSGSLSTSSTTTDASGRASVNWTLGTRPGTQSISAASAGLPGVTFNATAVAGPVATVVVSPAGAQLSTSETLQASAEARDAYGNVVSGKTATWSVSNTSVLSVDWNGRVTAVAGGTADVRATVDGVTGSQAVTVTAAGTGLPTGAYVEASPATVSFTGVGQTGQISASVKDSSGRTLSGYSFTFSSSAPSVVEVDSMGRLTARSVGTAFVVAATTCCSIADTVDVEVALTESQNPGDAVALFTDGFESGDLRKTGNGFRWGSATRTGVASNKGSEGSHSLRFDYPAAAAGQDSWSEQRFVIAESGSTAPNEVWVEFNLYVPDNWTMRSGESPENHKLFAIWAEDYSSSGSTQMVFEWDQSGSRIRALMMTGTGDAANKAEYKTGAPVLTTSMRGTWVRFRFHLKIASSANAYDGVAQVWRDNTLLYEATNLGWYYSGANNYFRNGYLLGWSNGGYSQLTQYYLDQFNIYTSNPGW